MPVDSPAGMSAASRQDLGILGEKLAVQALRDRGFAIVATRHRCRYGEIDIIAEDERCLVFVEVKLRRTDLFGEALEAIPKWKRRRIINAALDYLTREGQYDRPARFAVAAVDERRGELRVEIIDDAFTLDDG